MSQSDSTLLKVLFVCRTSYNGGCANAVVNQAAALKKAGVEVLFYEIYGKGITAYLKHLPRLRRYIKRTGVDVVHAHYGLTGMLAALAGAHPLVVSLMGSDIFLSAIIRVFVRFFSRFFWSATIVKSEQMHRLLGNQRAHLIPNGVDLELFREIPREEARRKAEFTLPKNILWASNPKRKVKNYSLAREAYGLLNCSETELRVVKDLTPDKMAHYLNASDVLLLTSHWEGSPNVVKEALACNIPVVSTPVGDVEELIQGVTGCAICQPIPRDLAQGLETAFALTSRTNSRERLTHLDSRLVSQRIIEVYKEVGNWKKTTGNSRKNGVGNTEKATVDRQ